MVRRWFSPFSNYTSSVFIIIIICVSSPTPPLLIHLVMRYLSTAATHCFCVCSVGGGKVLLYLNFDDLS